jgi:putative transposase
MRGRNRCTVHKHRNLLAHAPERLHEEITEDYNEMIYAKTPEEIEKHRKAFIRKWRLKHEAGANSSHGSRKLGGPARSKSS